MFWIREKSRMACLPFYFLKRWTYQISNGSRETDPMKLYFFTQKLGSLRKQAFWRPLTIFLTLYFVIVCSTKIKKKKHVQVQSWELPRIWTLQCRRFNHRSGVRVSKMIKCTINLSQNEQRLFSWMLYYSIVVVSLTNGFFPRSV